MTGGRIVIAGGTGLIGRALAGKWSSDGVEVVVLSRGLIEVAGARRVTWDAQSAGEWVSVIDGASAVINLSGFPVIHRWTADNKRIMRDSRVLSTRAIGEAIAACQAPPQTWINASAVGYYGDTGAREVSEATRAGEGFLPEMCQEWEQEVDDADVGETRRVKLRIGVVLARDGAFVKQLSSITKAFLGSAVGSGEQYISWIHIDDVVRIIDWCLESGLSGALNAVAPEPVTNAAMMAEFRRILKRRALPKPPTPVIRAVAWLRRMEPELLLTGQKVRSEIALANGFRFKFASLRLALEDLLAVPETVPTGN